VKIQSNFTIDDVKGFIDSYLLRERDLLAGRLQLVSDELAELAPLIGEGPGDGVEWNAHEILAHIAVVAKFYGVMVHRIMAGKLTDVALVDSVNLRDVAGTQMAEMPPDKIVEMARADIERTVSALRGADPASLRRTARIDDGTTLTAEEVARLPLVTHLEAHMDDLEKMLAEAVERTSR
jgi:hypothetical protein